MKRSLYIVWLGAALALGCDETTPSSTTAPPTTTTAATTTSASASAAPEPSASAPSEGPLAPLAYLPAMQTPADNALTEAKIALGKMLFFDKRLGLDQKFACENCHFVDKGWADALPVSTKADGKPNSRHTPALHNVGYQKSWYWDGRAATLEAQVLAAWKSQMGADPDKVAAELAKVDAYKKRFAEAFDKQDITADDVVKALASFVRSVRSGNAPFDKFEQGDKQAISESAARGWEIFRNKAACARCHAPPLFTDLDFHNVGVGMDKPEPDLGRFNVTKDDKDKGRFKTPSLRSVSKHPPYFHDGSAATLEAAVDYMLSGGHANDNLDENLKKVELTPEEKADLIAFLQALDGDQPFEPPTIP